MNGFILVNKPKGVTSHDVVACARKILYSLGRDKVKIGHGGTLDPNATGLLILAIGREYTKKLAEIAQKTVKTYEAEIILGSRSSTDDSEGKITKGNDSKNLKTEDIKRVLKSFLGMQKQVPPIYSAVKIKGKKAYELARKGKSIKLAARKIRVYDIRLVSYKYPTVKIVCKVSSGTYIRALARDIGEKIGTGAYLKELRRIRVGRFSIKNAVDINDLNLILN